MFDASLLDLPLSTLVTLAAGYMGYFIASVGLNEHHKTTEITFSTLAFGLIAALLYHTTMHYFSLPYLSVFIAVLAATLSGALWRKYGRKLFYALLRAANVSFSNNDKTAWQSMIHHTEWRVTEVIITLKNGTKLRSRDLHKFKDKPDGPIAFGHSGDIVLYVTGMQYSDDDDWLECEGVNHSSGSLATYLPADQIARVDIRRIDPKL